MSAADTIATTEQKDRKHSMGDEGISDKFRTREVDREDPIRTLLNSLTLEGIREAAYILAPTRRIKIRNHASSYEDLLQVKQPAPVIVRALLEVEAKTPLKHALLTQAVAPTMVRGLESKAGSSVSAGGFDFVLRAFFQFGDFAYVTFEHTVYVREWVETESADVRRIEQYETRHPIVVRVSLPTGIVLICYPGFTQGAATKRKSLIAYGDLLAGMTGSLSSLGLETHALPIRDALKVLLAGSNRRVHRVRADIEAANIGRFDLSSLNQAKTIEDSLADLFLPHLAAVATREMFIDSAKRAINDAETNFLILYWTEEAVLTRLKFWDIGCEMLFTWHGERASYRAIDSLLQLLMETQARLAPSVGRERGTALAWLSALPGGDVVQPARLAESLQITAASARQEMVYAVKAGLLAPVFRLVTNRPVDDTLNGWVDDPSALRRSWKLEGGEEIDGADPANIDVGFRRVLSAGGKQ